MIILEIINKIIEYVSHYFMSNGYHLRATNVFG